MNTVDRAGCDTQIGMLCAAYNVPATPERLEGYWTGLQRMALPALVRVVEQALGPDGPEKIPTTSGLWSIYRGMRAKGRTETATQKPTFALHPIVAFANRALVEFLRNHGPASPASCAAMVAEKNRLADQFRLIAAEEGVTGVEVRDAMFAAFRRLLEPMSVADMEAARAEMCRDRGLRFVPRVA